MVGKRRIWIANTGDIEKDLKRLSEVIQSKTLRVENCPGLIKRVTFYVPVSRCKLLQSGIKLVDLPGAETVDSTRYLHLKNSLKNAVSVFLFLDVNPLPTEIQKVFQETGIIEDLLVSDGLVGRTDLISEKGQQKGINSCSSSR